MDYKGGYWLMPPLICVSCKRVLGGYTGTWAQVSSQSFVNPYFADRNSSSGRYVLVADYGGYLYLSSNYGASFTKLDAAYGFSTAHNWLQCSISEDGTHMLAVAEETAGQIAISTNSGSSWTTYASNDASLHSCNVHWDALGSQWSYVIGRNVNSGAIRSDTGLSGSWGAVTGPVSGNLGMCASGHGKIKLITNYYGNMYTSSDAGFTYSSSKIYLGNDPQNQYTVRT